jgi:hypothetical protein
VTIKLDQVDIAISSLQVPRPFLVLTAENELVATRGHSHTEYLRLSRG